MKERFEKTVCELIKQLDLLVDFKIVYIKDSYNSLYVKQEQERFVIYVDIEEIALKKINIKPLIMHELYHIKQFLAKFPMIISDDNRFYIIQKIITDLYVDLELIKDNYCNEARELFLYRIKNIDKILCALNTEDVYRISLLIFEANNIFKTGNVEIEKKILKIENNITKNKIDTIYGIINKNYQDIIELYKKLIKIEDNKKEIILFDEKIII